MTGEFWKQRAMGVSREPMAPANASTAPTATTMEGKGGEGEEEGEGGSRAGRRPNSVAASLLNAPHNSPGRLMIRPKCRGPKSPRPTRAKNRWSLTGEGGRKEIEGKTPVRGRKGGM
jgi:hypothetical protein